MQLPSHGSNPHHLYNALGINPPEKIVDFSVNINPLGAPEAIKHNWGNWLADIYDYPDPTFAELKQTIAAKEGIEESCLLPGNGASELITLIARYLQGKKVLIIHPAFSEYEAACRSENCIIFYHILYPSEWGMDMESLQQKLKTADAVFFCHPNNPTGMQYDRTTIDWLIGTCEQSETLLILDEAFYDFADNPVTFIDEASQSPFLLVLRSLTKMYSIAGLRLGYLAGHSEVLTEIGKRQAHWSINAIALKAGKICLDDQQHVSQTRDYIKKERDRLFSFFRETGFQHSPSAINFYLIRDPSMDDQQELFTFLLRKGIVLRHTYNFPGIEGEWLRVAIKKEAENSLLMEALSEWKRVN
ncbi:threonine-phosphate decarboxylase [Virgibacillus sp. NKC19-16]|uniref:threonine-phosphate decarboxylase CobD n=1 Tax=Virgibacillus salidurans TaxID=2831673 RepID=UPI001EFFAD96|nr:threonine-phosphate decarboxylase CobD [Virgibacillus sp. NKC19-16]UJL46623.1 threonine-phosphate decarboxylase [Virgibacillus sp. NKC19-16]